MAFRSEFREEFVERPTGLTCVTQKISHVLKILQDVAHSRHLQEEFIAFLSAHTPDRIYDLINSLAGWHYNHLRTNALIRLYHQ